MKLYGKLSDYYAIVTEAQARRLEAEAEAREHTKEVAMPRPHEHPDADQHEKHGHRSSPFVQIASDRELGLVALDTNGQVWQYSHRHTKYGQHDEELVSGWVPLETTRWCDAS